MRWEWTGLVKVSSLLNPIMIKSFHCDLNNKAGRWSLKWHFPRVVCRILVFQYEKGIHISPSTQPCMLLEAVSQTWNSSVCVCVSSHHGVTSVSPWVWAVYSRAESGCVCGGGRGAEGCRDALQPPAQWRSDRRQLEEGKSIGSSTHLWPGESRVYMSGESHDA